jgi:hypothetical protein
MEGTATTLYFSSVNLFMGRVLTANTEVAKVMQIYTSYHLATGIISSNFQFL